MAEQQVKSKEYIAGHGEDFNVKREVNGKLMMNSGSRIREIDIAKALGIML